MPVPTLSSSVDTASESYQQNREAQLAALASLDEQLELTAYLLPRCPNLLGVSYEDPMYREDGQLVEKSRRNYARLRDLVADWQRGEAA